MTHEEFKTLRIGDIVYDLDGNCYNVECLETTRQGCYIIQYAHPTLGRVRVFTTEDNIFLTPPKKIRKLWMWRVKTESGFIYSPDHWLDENGKNSTGWVGSIPMKDATKLEALGFVEVEDK